MQTSADAKVRVRFVTTFDQFRIVDTPFVVPSKLGRSGLSEIVNHLLGNGDADNEDEEEVGRQPFDFMIGDRLVRISLNKFKIFLKIRMLCNKIHYMANFKAIRPIFFLNVQQYHSIRY